MSLQTINIGTAANDGTGDNLRTAFDKINENFQEILNNIFPFHLCRIWYGFICLDPEDYSIILSANQLNSSAPNAITEAVISIGQQGELVIEDANLDIQTTFCYISIGQFSTSAQGENGSVNFGYMPQTESPIFLFICSFPEQE